MDPKQFEHVRTFHKLTNNFEKRFEARPNTGPLAKKKVGDIIVIVKKDLGKNEQNQFKKTDIDVADKVEVRITGMLKFNNLEEMFDKIDVEKSLKKLMAKGLIIQNEKRDGLHRIPVWDLAPDVAQRMGEEKKSLFGITRKKLPTPVRNLKNLSEAIQIAKQAIEEEDLEKTIDIFDEFIETSRSGEEMIENFFDEHREIRLWKIRLKDRGVDYIIDNKEKMLDLFDNIESTITKKLREKVA